ncbi:MAG: isoprenylcysteine carboxylmethyltransferase family protein [Acidimicrobiales bacterium]
MWALVLAADVAFLAVAFGLRTVHSYRRTGRSGWLRPVSRVDAVAESLCTAGCVGTLAAPVLARLSVVPPAGRLSSGPVAAVGLACLLAGIVTSLAAQRQMGLAWKPGIDPAAPPPLVTTGLFRVARNPFYVGCMLSSLGVALAVPSVLALASLAAVVVAAEVVVRWVEEPFLEGVHGEAYRAYRRATARFLPGPARWRALRP